VGASHQTAFVVVVAVVVVVNDVVAVVDEAASRFGFVCNKTGIASVWIDVGCIQSVFFCMADNKMGDVIPKSTNDEDDDTDADADADDSGGSIASLPLPLPLSLSLSSVL
jgi:hypothetical protein